MKTGKSPHPAHAQHHLSHEGSHVMLPLVVLSVMAIGAYYLARRIDLLEVSRDALFYVVMLFVALGIAGLFGAVGAWLRSGTDAESERFCFAGALIGAVVFYVALLF